MVPNRATHHILLTSQQNKLINPFKASVAFHIENSNLISLQIKMTVFYMKCNTGLKWVNTVFQWKNLYNLNFTKML